jgi:methylisocitrate lyase
MPDPSTTPAASPGRRLRDAWTAEAIQVPGVFNPLVGRIAEQLGFRAAYLSGGALSASLGLPDLGLVTATEFADAARQITAACSLPLLCDADTGFGEALNTERTVRCSRLRARPGCTWRINSCRSDAVTCPARAWSSPR